MGGGIRKCRAIRGIAVVPNRIIREALLDSPRYMAIDEHAQLLFVHLLLLADDFGCLRIEHTYIGRRCFNVRPSEERLDRLINQLVDADLLRLYQHGEPDGNGGIPARYGFIPRFRQRLKRETLKNPQPPDELLRDDPESLEKFSQLKGKRLKGAALGPPPSAGGPPAAVEVKRSEVKGSEEKRSEGAPVDNSRSAVVQQIERTAAKATGRKS